MKVLFVTSAYFPSYGGLEAVVQAVSGFGQSAGHIVEIVTHRYPRHLPEHECVDGIPVTRLMFLYPRIDFLKSRRFDLWLAGLLFFPLSLIRFLLLMRRFRPDTVNLQYLGSPGLFVWVACLMFQFRFVVSLHGGDVDGEPYKNAFNRWVFRTVLKQADVVTSCSAALLDHALKLAPEIAAKSRVIHNGIDAKLFLNAEPYQHSHPYILGVGKLVHHKGFDVLVDAFAQLADKTSELDLLIAGTGELQETLQKRIDSLGLSMRAQLLGRKSREQVAALMRGATVIVIPSRREPFGIVGLEAMASGRPIISTRVGGLIEALEGADATWVPNSDPVSLTSALRKAIGNPLPPESMLEGNQQAACFRTWDKVSAEYFDALQG
jgi:glycogen(starch) synthase